MTKPADKRAFIYGDKALFFLRKQTKPKTVKQHKPNKIELGSHKSTKFNPKVKTKLLSNEYPNSKSNRPKY